MLHYLSPSYVVDPGNFGSFRGRDLYEYDKMCTSYMTFVSATHA